MKAAITGLTHYLPDYVLTNDELSQMVDTNDEWITTRVGIKERHILKDPHAGSSALAIPAVKELLEKTGTKPEEVDCFICASSAPDYRWPSTAAIICDACDIRHAMAYDIQAACSGFLFNLNQARAFIESGLYKKIIVCQAEKCSSFVDYTDRSTCPLFGDGGAAALIEPTEDDSIGIQDAVLYTNGAGNDHLILKAGGSVNVPTHQTVDDKWSYIFQDGRYVFKNAVTMMTQTAGEIMQKNHLTLDDIDWVCTHQANKRIIDAVRQYVGVSEDKVIINIEKVGNTSSASIPIALHMAAQEGKLKKGDTLLLAAFGSGFTYGSMILKWGDCKI